MDAADSAASDEANTDEDADDIVGFVGIDMVVVVVAVVVDSGDSLSVVVDSLNHLWESIIIYQHHNYSHMIIIVVIRRSSIIRSLVALYCGHLLRLFHFFYSYSFN